MSKSTPISNLPNLKKQSPPAFEQRENEIVKEILNEIDSDKNAAPQQQGPSPEQVRAMQAQQQAMIEQQMREQQMMEQLQKQQEELKEQLEELLGENPGQESGGLSKASEDMEEVVDDFRRRQVDRRTQDRQQRILSRMLDSQKSLTQKDYSEKRKSNTGEKIIYSGPTGLPSDMGEREMLLINAMESALQEGHSREYQNMMKQYFRSLQKGEETLSE